MKKITVSIFLILTILLLLCGCQSGKKFDSPESMISEMIGTYCSSDDYAGEYVIISEENVIKFNVNDIFPQIEDEKFFEENFSKEGWEHFDIDTLLEKPYVEVIIEPVSADVKNSSLSGLWINKNGVLYSQKKNGYPLKKISSDFDYPTQEMLEQFDEYVKYLQEYEVSLITKEAKENALRKKESLDSVLSSPYESSVTKGESNASAQTIAQCAFDSLKNSLKYPSTAKLGRYSTTPQKDSYGRVMTLIECTYQNGFGNYTTEEIYVILQSCTSSGEYTYSPGFHYYIDRGDADMGVEALAVANHWDQEPSQDTQKETAYTQAIQLAKDGEYELAIEKLKQLSGYEKSDDVIAAYNDYIAANKYKSAIDLFINEQYTEACLELMSLTDQGETEYLRADRVIYLCHYLDNKDLKEDSDPSSNNNQSQNSSDYSEPVDNDSQNSENVHSDDVGSNVNSQNSGNAGSQNTNSQNSGNADSQNTNNDPNGSNTNTGPCANGHTWVAVTETVHHDEVGHYETVQDAKKVVKYQCPICYNLFDSDSLYYSHFDQNHKDDSTSEIFRDRYEKVERYEYYETQKWVVDCKAYDETITKGYQCSVCGKTK